MTDQPASLAEALALLQTQLPHIGKDKTATVTSQRTGKTHKYDYANLATVSEQILPLLGKLGLSFTCAPTIIPTPTGFYGASNEKPPPPPGTLVLEYVLRHAASAEKITGYYPLPGSGSPQEIGSAITYARRYCLCAVTGVAPDDDDDDGHAAEQAAAQKPKRESPPRRPMAELPRNTDGSVSRSRTTDDELAATGQMTDAQIREHGRLERDVKGTGPQGTQRLTATPADDPWYRAEPLPMPRASQPIDARIAMHFARLGVTDRDVRLGHTARLAGRDTLGSTKELTAAEGLVVEKALARCKDAAAFERLLLGEAEYDGPLTSHGSDGTYAENH